MIDFRHLTLSCMLVCSVACVTPAGDTAGTGTAETAIASNATAGGKSSSQSEKPVVVMEEEAVVGKSATGEKVYCRRRAPIGSRVPMTKCVTEGQRRKQEEFAKEIFKNQDLRR